MNADTAREVAETKKGELITHAKGGMYRIIGPCRIQIQGEWCDGLIYYSNGVTYVRSVDDCAKLNLFVKVRLSNGTVL